MSPDMRSSIGASRGAADCAKAAGCRQITASNKARAPRKRLALALPKETAALPASFPKGIMRKPRGISGTRAAGTALQLEPCTEADRSVILAGVARREPGRPEAVVVALSEDVRGVHGKRDLLREIVAGREIEKAHGLYHDFSAGHRIGEDVDIFAPPVVGEPST